MARLAITQRAPTARLHRHRLATFRLTPTLLAPIVLAPILCVLLLAGCAPPPPAPIIGAAPDEAGAQPLRYRSVIGPYVSQRPSSPSAWGAGAAGR